MDRGRQLQLADYGRVLRRRWLSVVAPLVLVVGAAVAYTTAQEPVYRASAEVLLRSSAAESAVTGRDTNAGLLSRALSNEVSYATSDALELAVARRLVERPEVTVSGNAESDTLRFTATATTPDDAARFANTWAETYVAEKRAGAVTEVAAASVELRNRLAELEQQRQALRAPADELRAELAELLTSSRIDAATAARIAVLDGRLERLEEDLAPELALLTALEASLTRTLTDLETQGELASAGTALLVTRAKPPEAAANATIARNGALAVVAGLVLGVGLALVRENLDTRLRSAQDVEASVGLPVLGVVPRRRRRRRRGMDVGLASFRQPTSPVAEAYHSVRAALLFAMATADVRSMLVTSANQSEGKTTTSANLAWALAAAGRRTVLVDGDFRRPRIHQVYGFKNREGITDHVLVGTPVDRLYVEVSSDDTMLRVLPTGPLPPAPSEFVASSEFRRFLGEVTAEAEVVVIDGPPVLPVNDALDLSRHVDGVLLVAYAGQTRREELAMAVRSLRLVGAQVLGVVLVAVKGGHHASSGGRGDRWEPARTISGPVTGGRDPVAVRG